jgi:hypothetical protein
METMTDKREVRRRRWNAAVVQQYVKRRARFGIGTHVGDLLAAREVLDNLVGLQNVAELLEEGLSDLLARGLLIATPLPTGGSDWWPVDIPMPRDRLAAEAGLLEAWS